MIGPDIFALGGRQDDAELFEAERQLTELRRQRKSLRPEDEAGYDALTMRIFAAYETISRTSPKSLAGAAVKFRLLLDPEIGIRLHVSDDDLWSIRQIAQMIEWGNSTVSCELPAPPVSAPIETAAAAPNMVLPPVLLLTDEGWTIGYWCERGWFGEDGVPDSSNRVGAVAVTTTGRGVISAMARRFVVERQSSKLFL